MHFGCSTWTVDTPIYLTEADVGRLVTVKDAIASLEELFATWGSPRPSICRASARAFPAAPST